MTAPSAGLYVHIPFCAGKCRYCDFYSLAAGRGTKDRYAALLLRLLEAIPFGPLAFHSVYFGGGTPPLLGAAQLERVLAAALEKTLPGSEITLEANPNTAGAPFLRRMRRAGFNRLSLGLQSSDAGLLRQLGRTHTAGDVAAAVTNARAAGFSNLSLDVMLGLPGQARRQLEETLHFCVSLGVQHISAYMLKIEENTPFYREGVAALCPDEDAQADDYLFLVDYLVRRGYRQYEISNFALPGWESRHNLGYWRLSPYLGLGPAAHSFIDGRRWHFGRDLPGLLASADPWALLEEDGPGGGFEEYAMLSLRLREGLPLAVAQERYGVDTRALLARAAPALAHGLARLQEGRLSLTPQGFLLSNTLIAQLLWG